MIDINQYYKSESDYLKATDLPKGKKVRLTIADISVTEFEEDNNGQKYKKNKLTLSFSSTEKKLVLNKTNALSIGDVLGVDADLWRGREIFVYSKSVSFGDKMVDAIRVDLPMEETTMPPQQQAPVQQQPQQAAPQQQATQQIAPNNQDEFSDDIPF